MNNLKFKLIFITTLLLTIFSIAQAQTNPLDITFPIVELGNCGSLEDCKIYCDNPVNSESCFSWAQSRGISKKPPKIESRVENGPGGCSNEKECHDYCENPDNIKECVAFAEKKGLIKPEQARRAIEMHQKTGPGGCKGERECKNYCSDPKNNLECINFAEAEGFMSPEEAKRAREHANKRGPGGCQSKRECDNYCKNPDNSKECIRFAVDEGFMSQEEADRILKFMDERIDRFTPPRGPRGPRGPDIDDHPDIDKEKVLQILSQQDGPGGCSSFEECDAFCSQPKNDEICMNFAIEHNLIPPKEIERIEKLRNIEGPGGCRGRECENYCEEPGHELECIEFAEAQGFMDPEEAREAKKFIQASINGGPGGCKGRECEAYCDNPDHRDECFEFAKSNDLISPEELKMMERGMELERKVQDQGGPGGCRNERECRSYCQDPEHFDECAAFAVESGIMSPEEAEMMIKQFIDTEHDFGPGGHRDFGPGPGPGEFDGTRDFRSDEKFNSRFEDFERHRGEFERRRFEEESRMMMPRDMPMEGNFPMSDDFPGHMEFPGEGGFPPPDEFPREGSFPIPDRFHEGFPPSDQFSPEGDFGHDGNFQDKFQKSIEDEMRFKMEEQMRRETEERIRIEMERQMMKDFMPPLNDSDMHMEGEFIPPPSEFEQKETEPVSVSSQPSLLGVILGPFLELFTK